MFNISLINPIQKILQYTNFLNKEADVKSCLKDLDNNKINYLLYSKKKFHSELFTSNFKTIIYTLNMDPKKNNKFGFYKNFYEVLDKKFSFNTPFYCSNDIVEDYNHLKNSLKDQENFINKIKKIKEMYVTENDILNYKNFMSLAKKNKDKNLVPTFMIDIIWHGHMLNNEIYVKDTTNYFGYILNHNDSVDKSKLENDFELTSNLWEKEFGTKYTTTNTNINKNIHEHNTFDLSAPLILTGVSLLDEKKNDSSCNTYNPTSNISSACSSACSGGGGGGGGCGGGD